MSPLMTLAAVTVSMHVATYILTLIIPGINGLIWKVDVPQWVRETTSIVLSFVVALFVEQGPNGYTISDELFWETALIFLGQLFAYHGVYKRLGGNQRIRAAARRPN
jgi:hypothetical protein